MTIWDWSHETVPRRAKGKDMLQLNTLQTIQYAREKAVLETEIGRRMYTVFNSQPVIGELRALVREAVVQLAALATRTTDGAANKVSLGRELFEIRDVIQKESPLAVWRGRAATPETLARMAGESGTWSAADCSDLIRLFVSVIERVSQESGTGRYRFQADAAGRMRPQAVQGTLPGYQNVRDIQKAYRPDFAGQPHVWKDDRARKGGPPITTGTHTLDARGSLLATTRTSGAPKGISRYRLEPRSTVRKIDLVFGLPEGADISGTTTDSIFFMESIDSFLQAIGELPGAVASLGPMLQLLAPATMVPLGHHTLLETSLSLTLNGYVSYSIGFYSTLMPHNSPRNEAWAKLDGIFLWAERHAWNHRMLCYYDHQGLKAYVYGVGGGNPRAELAAFRAAAMTSLDFLWEFRTFPVMPDRRRVDEYKADFGLP